MVWRKWRRMTTRKPNWWKIGGVLLVLVLVQVLFDPLTGLQHLGERLQARMYLPAARQKWEAKGITHYRFDIRGSVPLVCIFGGGIEVRDGLVIPRLHSDAGNPDAMLYPGFSRAIDPPLCNDHNYTMPGLFELVEAWLELSPSTITGFSIDPQYGFITSFSFGNPDGKGLLNPTVSDCCGFFVIENFQVLED